jgi:hypothetical protein
MSVDLSPVLDKIYEEYGKRIHCGPGWHDLILECHLQLMMVDPDYRIFQIKEKYGELRFYAHSDDPWKKTIIDYIIEKYEVRSTSICEMTGLPGVLMKNGSWYKTLNPENAPEGYEKVYNDF